MTWFDTLGALHSSTCTMMFEAMEEDPSKWYRLNSLLEVRMLASSSNVSVLVRLVVVFFSCFVSVYEIDSVCMRGADCHFFS